MRRSVTATCAAVAALVVAACGTRVDPEVFARLTEGGAVAGEDLGPGAGPAGTVPASPASDATAGGTGGGTVAGPVGAATGAPPTAGDTSPGASPAGEGSGPTAGGAPAAAADGGGGEPEEPPRNRASDTGVRPDLIRVGNITTVGGPLGPHVFTPMVEGARAYLARLNARGGVNGRRVELLTCDDRGDPDRNRQCARNLVEQQGVFALVANSTLSYAAAGYVSEQGVPDVGGQPIGYGYFTFPTLFAVRGAEYPRDGQLGYRGRLYNGTAIFRELRSSLGVRRAAVFYYNIPQSKAYGRFQAQAARAEGYTVTEYEVNPALPSYDSYVADMRAKGIDAIFDALDLTGNQNLCQSMQRNDLSVTAKVTISQSWSRRIEAQFPPICKQSLYAWGESRPYSQDLPELREFREAMRAVYGDAAAAGLHQWHLEGWIAARMLVEGIDRMGAAPTRAGLIGWLSSFRPDQGYGAGGLMVPQSWRPIPYDQQERTTECISVARWDPQRRDFVTYRRFPICHQVPWIAWTPAA